MKKLFTLIALAAMCALYVPTAIAQDAADQVEEVASDAVEAAEDAAQDGMEAAEAAVDGAMEEAGEAAGDMAEGAGEAADEMMEEVAAEMTGEADAEDAAEEVEVTGMDAQIKKYFIQGGPTFMAMVLLCLILGLALCIERIIYLNMSSTNTSKLLANVEDAMMSGGVEGAKEVCRNTRGPVASIFYQALDRSGGEAAGVEKAINDYGGVQMALLERGLSWISLFIAIAPMLGFLGTVIGMIKAFDDIQSAGAMSATVVAGGIKVALITTVSGLIVAIILQIFYNYILSKIDGLVLDMEESSIDMVDMIIRQEAQNK